jgi:Undecaprenyl-phosphate galactose phosphotransferase WbaP
MNRQQEIPSKKAAPRLTYQKKILSLLILVLSDFAVVILSLSLAYLIRIEILPRLFEVYKQIGLVSFNYFLQYFYFAGIWITVFANEKLYTKRFLFWEEVKILLKSTTISSSLIMILIFVARKQVEFSRTIVISVWVLSLLLFPLFRLLTKTLLVKCNIWNKKLLIIGVLQTALLVLKCINKNKTMGYEILGFLDDDPEKIGKTFGGVKVLGPISELENVAKAYGSKDIMVATPHLSREKIKTLLAKCETMCESLWLIPRTGDFITEGVEINTLGEVFVLNVKRNLTKPWNILSKNLFDITLTVILIILALPLMLLISIIIRLDSKGPMFFIQKRLGQREKPFGLYKFRSMSINSEHLLSEYLEKNPKAREEWKKYKKLKNYDPRVTKVGRYLRRYSLDELPQLFNIIQGKMSLVGPRPYLVEELEGKTPFKRTLSRVKPGITGLWQTSGRSELPFDKRIELDEFYIRNWSLWQDLTIIMKSIKIWLSGRGAY